MAESRSWLIARKKRLRSRLKFELDFCLNALRWSADDLERDEWAREARDIRWSLVDLDDEIRALEYACPATPDP